MSREFSHCKHFIEWFVILSWDVYRYTRTFEISVRYQPAHVASRSGGAQNPCPSAISAAFAMIWHEISPSASCSVSHVRYALNRSWCNIVITGEERGNACIDTRNCFLWSRNICDNYTLTRHDRTKSQRRISLVRLILGNEIYICWDIMIDVGKMYYKYK